MTPFIQPCIGHAFWPLAPQSKVFGPAAASPPAAALVAGAAAALAAVLATSVGGAAADSAGAALGATFATSGVGAGAALGAGVAAEGFASGVAVPSGLLSLQPKTLASATIAANRTTCLILLSLVMALDRVFRNLLTPYVSRRGFRTALPDSVPDS